MEEQPNGKMKPLINVEDIMWWWFFDYHKQRKSITTGDILVLIQLNEVYFGYQLLFYTLILVKKMVLLVVFQAVQTCFRV